SRRRHTRWPRDWSSDVCSSDLGAQQIANALAGHRRDHERLDTGGPLDRLGGLRAGGLVEGVDLVEGDQFGLVLQPLAIGGEFLRSEERRVGKEGSAGVWGGHGE